MASEQPILILGFGRSGTTWMSDIISKSLGGLILFEPMHPEVLSFAKHACYSSGLNDEMNNQLSKHLKSCLCKEVDNRWLIRNHLSANLQEVNEKYVEMIWRESDIIGMKLIRGNFMIPWLYQNVSKRIIYLEREVKSVVASILKRPQFWMEFGFDFHYHKFTAEVINGKYRFLWNEKEMKSLLEGLEFEYEKITVMWALTSIVANYELGKLGIPVYSYEELYKDPYKVTREILTNLSGRNVAIHPSYIFTPSMLTHKTSHDLRIEDSFFHEADVSVFWRERITNAQSTRIDYIMNRIGRAAV
ncbi:MAG: hypothetical protein ACMVP2_11260 [Imperialibacter sp.]|uniref:hypothetical protein n=1 Tax=Imperialibacter sp. TaxID=2038411 RepID=UPI0030DAAC8B|tara:strand:- start:184 stop:1092 length:909 start_codon:yes stop_codon:yes gene_type:complete